jgi:hypothetical protein
MPSAELSKIYKNTLDKAGLSIDKCSKEYWASFLKITQDVNKAQYRNLHLRSDSEIDKLATGLSLAGGDWNYRIQQLVPSIVDSAHQCLRGLQSKTASQLKMPTDAELFFGEYPTGRFNAQVEKVDCGFLILINRGLPELISQMGELLSECRPAFNDKDLWENRVAGAANYASAIAKKYRTESGFVFLEGDQNLRTDKNALDKLLNDWVLEATLAFVVSHEIAHIVLNHLDAGRNSLTLGTPKTHLVKPRFWREELSADSLGALILEIWAARKILNQKLDEDHALLFLSHCLFAPFFFFDCERLILTASGGETPRHIADPDEHPPASLRQLSILELWRTKSKSHKYFLTKTNRYRRFFKCVRRRIDLTRITAGNNIGLNATVGGVEDLKELLLKLAKQHGFGDRSR